MLEYEENCLEEYKEYAPYSLGYDEEQSLEEIDYAIHKGKLDKQTALDFREYLQYLKKKLSMIREMELGEGNSIGELPHYISRVQELLSSINNQPVL